MSRIRFKYSVRFRTRVWTRVRTMFMARSRVWVRVRVMACVSFMASLGLGLRL